MTYAQVAASWPVVGAFRDGWSQDGYPVDESRSVPTSACFERRLCAFADHHRERHGERCREHLQVSCPQRKVRTASATSIFWSGATAAA